MKAASRASADDFDRCHTTPRVPMAAVVCWEAPTTAQPGFPTINSETNLLHLKGTEWKAAKLEVVSVGLGLGEKEKGPA